MREQMKKVRRKKPTKSKRASQIYIARSSALRIPDLENPALLYEGRAETLLSYINENRNYADLVLTSPPYNLGKEYEKESSLAEYLKWQKGIIKSAVKCLAPRGNICWQVGNYVSNGEVLPLDILLHPIFVELGLQLRNRIVWKFGHGLHARRRFSGRYEVVLWYTKQNDYFFDLESVRVPSKYPGKRHYKGPKKGRLSSNPNGKNPEDIWEFEADVWDIPNVKGNHLEKTIHPCQFPVGLAERLILALCPAGGLVLDPFSGVASAGVAAILHNRLFIGSEKTKRYVQIGAKRLKDTISGNAKYRPHDRPIYDHTQSPLARRPRR